MNALIVDRCQALAMCLLGIHQEFSKPSTPLQFKLPSTHVLIIVGSSSQCLFTLYICHTHLRGADRITPKVGYVTLLCNMKFMVSPPPIPSLASWQEKGHMGAESICLHTPLYGSLLVPATCGRVFAIIV